MQSDIEKMKRAIVFAPHPDDEILGCGGTIAKRISEGYDISIIFMTDGRNSLMEIGVCSHPSPFELKDIRKAEAKRAAKILGIKEEKLFFLDFEDGALLRSEDLAKQRILEFLSNFPDEVYLPQENEFHIDHRVTNRLVKSVIKKLNFHPLEFHYAIAWLYPLNLLVRVRPDSLQNLIMSKLLKKNVVAVDVSDYLSLKKAALEEYQSQIKILADGQRRAALKNSFLKRFLQDKEKFFVERGF
jgi:LmbE family N-acetylglucosaminyl deacetylase